MLDIQEDACGIIFNADGSLELITPKDIKDDNRNVKDHELVAIALMYGLSEGDEKLHTALQELMQIITDKCDSLGVDNIK